MAAITLTSANFEEEVLKSDVPVLVDFWASWCGPCKMLGPMVEQVAEESDGSFKVGKVNVDDEGELAEKYGIMNCIECGSCSFICPSTRPILDMIRVGKAKTGGIIRARNAK